LTFNVVEFTGLTVQSVTILDDSSIEYTPVGPGRLDVRIIPPRTRQRAGKPFTVGYRIWRIDGRPPEQTHVALMSDDRNVRISPPSRDLGTVAAPVSGTFRVVSSRWTFTELTLVVGSSSSGAQAGANVRIERRGRARR